MEQGLTAPRLLVNLLPCFSSMKKAGDKKQKKRFCYAQEDQNHGSEQTANNKPTNTSLMVATIIETKCCSHVLQQSEVWLVTGDMLEGTV